MKKYKTDLKAELFEIIIPAGDGAGEDGLYHDCPLCQEIRKNIENGNGEPVIVKWEDEDAN